MIDAELLKLLCCPETHQEVRVAEAPIVEQLNGRIFGGGLKNRSGEAVSEKLDGGLVRADGEFLYPIRREIPVMLVDQAIPLTGAA